MRVSALLRYIHFLFFKAFDKHKINKNTRHDNQKVHVIYKRRAEIVKYNCPKTIPDRYRNQGIKKKFRKRQAQDS